MIYPKLFRRATDYLRAGAASVGTLPDWLQAHPDTEDDMVEVSGADAVLLHTLLAETATTVTFTTDLLDLVFIER